MKLYLVQHAEALGKEIDPDRPLSDKGLADAAKMAKFLQGAGISVDEVVHSGKTRAEQTATLLAIALCSSQMIVKMDGLKPNDSTDHLLHAAETAGGDLMAVGHLPFMAKMAARCLSSAEDGLAVAFEPGAVVCLERKDSGWTLNWMQCPSMLVDA